MKKEKMNIQLFANETVTTDLDPAISIDFTTRLNSNIIELQTLLGVTEMVPMAAGTAIKLYVFDYINNPGQVAEGVTIPLTEIEHKPVRTIDLSLQKYRRQTTAEAIQKVGEDLAINQTDDYLIKRVQKNIKNVFFDTLLDGEGAAGGTTLQATLAASWGELKKVFEDEDVTPIYFASSEDVASYLGTASITLQTAFGLTYVEDFLGLGTLVVSPKVPKGTVYATAKENLNGAYVPANGDIADTFGLTYDPTGLVGMNHSVNTDNATIDTLVMSGVVFFAENLSGVIVGRIDSTPSLGALTVASAAGTKTGDTAITITEAKQQASNVYKYKVGTAAADVKYGQNVKPWTSWDGKSDITAETGKVITVVEATAGIYRAEAAGHATVIAK